MTLPYSYSISNNLYIWLTGNMSIQQNYISTMKGGVEAKILYVTLFERHSYFIHYI